MGLFKNNIIIAIIVLIVISAGGFYFLGRDKQDENVLLTSESADTGVDRELLASLLELKSLKFNPALFENDVFKSFKDFSRDIPDEPAGRPNPFAPVGVDKEINVSTTTRN